MPVPRKVLHVIDSLDLGGAQTFLLDLVKNHDRALYLPEVAAMHGRGVFASAFVEAGIPVHSLSPGKFPPWYLPNFCRLMTGGYDILHFHLFGANLCAKPLAILAGHPAIIVHDQCNDASRDKNPFLLAADALWNRSSDRVIAVSESTRRYLLANEDLGDCRVTTIPNGVDTEIFHPASHEERQHAREIMGIPSEALVIGGVGRLVPQKNFALFLKIADAVLKDHPKAFFVIAGTGPQDPELRKRAEDLQIARSVRFLGHVTDRKALFHALDVLLMTSDFEGTPMVLLEAMSSGVPVVASAVDGIAEVCRDRIDSLLAPRGDLTAFQQAISDLVRDGSQRESLGAAGRRTIQEQYDIGQIARRVEDVYAAILQE
jgi:L-malate glycosyltransferase